MGKESSKEYLKEEFVKLYKEGKSLNEIAAQYKMSKTTVGKYIKQEVALRPLKPNEENVHEMFKMYLLGSTKAEIAEYFSVSPVCVGNLLLKYYDVQKTETRKREFEHFQSGFVACYNDGQSLKSIADKYGVSIQTVSNYLTHAGEELRTYSEASRKYEVNDNYFQTIDETNAFTLGIIYEIGGKAHQSDFSFFIHMSLRIKERYILDYAARQLCAKPTDENYVTDDNVLHVRIYSKKIYDDLEKIGFTEKDKSFPKITGAVLDAFMDGYILASTHITSRTIDIHIKDFTRAATIDYLTKVVHIDEIYIRTRRKFMLQIEKISELKKLIDHFDFLYDAVEQYLSENTVEPKYLKRWQGILSK